VRILFRLGEEEHAGTALVLAAVLHAALLHQLQHQFPAIRDVWHHIPSLFGADVA
jgi:hypothetical protein